MMSKPSGSSDTFSTNVNHRTLLTFSVMSSEQEANRLPVGSHLMAFTSFYKVPTQGHQQGVVPRGGIFLKTRASGALPCVLGRS